MRKEDEEANAFESAQKRGERKKEKRKINYSAENKLSTIK
jgi:hypothetical protein